ncbi:MAG: phosphoribosylanthranilate isomerase [bacterium]|nr:phosphoribosylanthranilate isomerase [bacterium]
MRVWLKFCGFCDPTDLSLAVALGVDAVGLVCVPDSPRGVSRRELAKLAAVPRGSSQLVLVFQNPSSDYVQECLAIVEPDVLQFHGDERPEFAESFDYVYIKAVRGRQQIGMFHAHTEADAWLIDDADYERNDLLQAAETPLILAGGLTPDNVQTRIRAVQPYGVDVARGIELEPRKKDPIKMIAFNHAVRSLANE